MLLESGYMSSEVLCAATIRTEEATSAAGYQQPDQLPIECFQATTETLKHLVGTLGQRCMHRACTPEPAFICCRINCGSLERRHHAAEKRPSYRRRQPEGSAN